MSKRRILIFAALFLGGLFFTLRAAFSYEPEPTHASLAQKSAQVFVQYYGVSLSQADIAAISSGARDEDTPPRWINHFFDPTTGQGWTSERMGALPPGVVRLISDIALSGEEPIAAPDWAQNQNTQVKYWNYGGNRTWQKAVFDYVNGNRSEALKSLGHILHLIEDMSVPAHTRQDTHYDAAGDPGEPYERWVKDNTDLSHLNNLDPRSENLRCGNLNECFNQLAEYSNENFFSEDTINSNSYRNILADRKEKQGEIEIYYRLDGNNNEYILAVYDGQRKVYTLKRNIVHQSYWRLLSKQAVLTGVEVIRLFFDEAAKAQTDKSLLEPPAEQPGSAFGNLYTGLYAIIDQGPRAVFSPFGELTKITNFFNSVRDSVSSFFSNAVGSVSGLFSSIFQPAQLPAALPPNLPVEPAPIVLIPSVAVAPPIQTAAPPRVILPQGRVVVARQGETGNNQIIEQTSPQDRQIPSEITENKLPQDAVLPSPSMSPSATPSPDPSASPSPSPIATTTLAYSGGIGGLTQEEQETTEQASTSTGAVAPEISISLVGYSLAARSFFVTWQSSSTDVLFDAQQKQGLGDWQERISATTSTSTLFRVPQDLTTYYFRARAVDNATTTTGNATSSDWQEISASINFYPVVINEIAWAGTSASTSADEWIELYNKTNQRIDLSGWILRSASDNTPSSTLAGKVEPNGFFLLERTGDDTIIDVSADQIYTGALNNTGEIMELLDKFGNLIDRIPLSDSNKWLAGSGNPNYQSMERVNPYLPADIPGNWQSNSTSTRNGLNVDGQPINGTPKAQNSVFNPNFFYLYSAQNITATSTFLKWAPFYINNFKEYKVIRFFDATSSAPIIIATATSTDFFDQTLESEADYYYQILACDNLDNCVASNIIQVKTPEFPFFWAEPQIISQNATSSIDGVVNIILNAANRSAITWYNYAGMSDRSINFSEQQADGRWSKPESITDEYNPYGFQPQIMSYNDRMEILFTGEVSGENGAPYDIFDWRANGGIWEKPQNIFGGDNGYMPSAVIDSFGVTHVVWIGENSASSTRIILYRTILPDGTLGEIQEITGSQDGVSPSLTIDSQNRLRVFWHNFYRPYPEDKIFYSTNILDGAGWSAAQAIAVINGLGPLPERLEVLNGEANQTFFTWEENYSQIKLAEFDGATTTQKAIFSQIGKNVGFPKLFFSNSKKLYLLWVGKENSTYGLYFASLKSDNEWQPIKKILELPSRIRWPKAVVDFSNIAHLVWYGGEIDSQVYYTFAKIE